MISENNYRHNIQIYDKLQYGRMINGQAVDYVSEMRYGLCRMSFNGCEVIAVHNALVYLKKTVPMYEVSHYMESFRMLAGIFGCNPFKIGKALEYFGIKCISDRTILNPEVFIMSFWTGKCFFSSIHTVFCVRTKKGITVYNRYNNCPYARIYRNISEIAIPEKIIAVYTIRGV
ncbi:MAG: hypothetical protein NC177_00675 [Ruminococcus flavefaciens]|nr:hypothetical protein [Ruminococcus flavefaciens]